MQTGFVHEIARARASFRKEESKYKHGSINYSSNKASSRILLLFLLRYIPNSSIKYKSERKESLNVSAFQLKKKKKLKLFQIKQNMISHNFEIYYRDIESKKILNRVQE